MNGGFFVSPIEIAPWQRAPQCFIKLFLPGSSIFGLLEASLSGGWLGIWDGCGASSWAVGIDCHLASPFPRGLFDPQNKFSQKPRMGDLQEIAQGRGLSKRTYLVASEKTWFIEQISNQNVLQPPLPSLHRGLWIAERANTVLRPYLHLTFVTTSSLGIHVLHSSCIVKFLITHSRFLVAFLFSWSNWRINNFVQITWEGRDPHLLRPLVFSPL